MDGYLLLNIFIAIFGGIVIFSFLVGYEDNKLISMYNEFSLWQKVFKKPESFIIYVKIIFIFILLGYIYHFGQELWYWLN